MVQKLYPHEFLIKRFSVSPACGLDPSTDGFAVLQKPLADLVSYPDALYLFLKHATDEEILAMFFFTEEEGWLKERVSQLLQCTERIPVIRLFKSQLGLLGEEAKECLQCTIETKSRRSWRRRAPTLTFREPTPPSLRRNPSLLLGSLHRWPTP